MRLGRRETEREQRYVPSLERIEEAAAQLPDADKHHGETHVVQLDNGRSIEFRRIKFKDTSGRSHRWIYEGKVLV